MQCRLARKKHLEVIEDANDMGLCLIKRHIIKWGDYYGSEQLE